MYFGKMKVSDFGKDFLWGVATSAAQIEGAAFEAGRAASIWDTFASKKGKIKDGSTPKVACDFYHRYASDLKLCKSLGFKVFRFSISWSRVLPLGYGRLNPLGISFYNQLIDECLLLGLIPMITLYHWDLPQALQDEGGWAGYQTNNAFKEFTTLCAKEFGDRVKHWIVINEPFGFTSLGYMLGMHAPGTRSLNDFFQSVHHVALAQGDAARILRHYVKDAIIGTAFSCSQVLPFQQNEADIETANRIDALMNRLFVEPCLGMDFPTANWDVLEKFKISFSTWRFIDRYQFDFDFIGLQNYFPMTVKFNAFIPIIQAWEVKAADRNCEITDMGWEVSAEGFYQIIKQFAAYKEIKNIMITENGAFFKDDLQNGSVHDHQRIAYFKSYLAAMLKAKREGVPITGYLLWTLVDNFEWAEGNKARFGIVHNDFETQLRTVKDSGLWWQKFLNEK